MTPEWIERAIDRIVANQKAGIDESMEKAIRAEHERWLCDKLNEIPQSFVDDNDGYLYADDICERLGLELDGIRFTGRGTT